MKILIANTAQFGYHSDTWYYSKYLSRENSVNYICWDYGEPQKKIEGVECFYVSRVGCKILRLLRFLSKVSYFIKISHPDIVFLKYFPLCFLLRFTNPRTLFIFDVRTGSVSGNKLNRVFSDTILRFESFFFKNKTIVSKSLGERLKISGNIFIVPVGSEIISKINDRKNFYDLSLIYIGTLNGRNLAKTVLGVGLFLKKHPEISLSYKVLGRGCSTEEELLRKTIDEENLSSKISLVGYVSHEKIADYLDEANVGVSFVPKTEYYDKQPVTKTFEYLLSGLPVIATSTFEHKIIINDSNGVLIEDTPESFANALEEVHIKIMSGVLNIQVSDYYDHTWESISDKIDIYMRACIREVNEK